MWQIVLCAFIALSGVVFSNVNDYLRKITDKTGLSRIGNIDYIYMINLDERPEKFQASASQLSPYGIFPYRFSAVNGWKLSLQDVNTLGTRYSPAMGQGHWGTFYPVDGDGEAMHEVMSVKNKVYFSHCMSRGAIGIVLSHLSILRDAYDSGYKTIWVMEDDIEVVRDPRVLSDLIVELDSIVGKSGWDILFTDPDTKANSGQYVPCAAYAWRPNIPNLKESKFTLKQDINRSFRRVGSRYGAYSMIVRRSGMRKILDFFNSRQIFLPYDMEFTLPEGIRLFTLKYDVVSTMINASSDNGAPNYRKIN